MKISVIIPACDRAEFCQGAVGSVVSQSRPAHEIIVVDNGRASLDQSAFPDAMIIRTAPRIGISRARNVGAAEAEGDVLAFLDDDDYWKPGYLEKMLDRMEREQAQACVARLERDKDGELAPHKLFPSDSRRRRVFFSNPGFMGSNFIIRREVFDAIGTFDETLPASEDRDIAAALILAGHTIAVEPDAIAVQRAHPGPRSGPHHARGNLLFLRKHWRNMKASELYWSSRFVAERYAKRYAKGIVRRLRGQASP